MKNRNLRYIYNVIGLAVIMFLALREFLSAVVLNINFAPDSLLVYFVAMAVFAASVLIPTITVENMLGLHPKLFGKTDPAKTAAAVAYSYLLIIGAGVVNAVVLAIFSSMGLEFRPVELTVPDGFFRTLLYLVYVSVLPAVLEEIFVRGYILNALRGFGTTFWSLRRKRWLRLKNKNQKQVSRILEILKNRPSALLEKTYLKNL